MRLTRGLVLLLAFSSATAAGLLVHSAIRTRPGGAVSPRTDLVDVLVASRAVTPGEMVGKDQVRWQPWPRHALPAGGFHRERNGSGGGKLPFEPAPARFYLIEGEPLSPAKLIQPEQGSALAALLSPDKRAVSVPIREETSAGGFVQPADRVDVIVTRKRGEASQAAAKSEILLRGVKVLAIGKALNGKGSGGKTATLELTPPQARTLTAAQAGGEVTLALIGSAAMTDGDFPTASIAEPATEIRVMKYGRSSHPKTIE
jgi:pilus assembly protein CpaB